MNARGSMKRLLALRVLEEERVEAELRKQRQLRQVCIDALLALEISKVHASRALYAGLESGDRTEAIAAEMALACGPMQQRNLQRRLVLLDEVVETTAAAWQASRVHRLQMETILETAEKVRHREMLTREQKALDGWFLSGFSSSPSPSEESDKSFQREWAVLQGSAGMVSAEDRCE